MAKPYQNILLATDLSPDNDYLIERAQQLAQCFSARLSLLHVVENIPIYFGDEMVLPETQEIEARLVERAKKHMHQLAEQLGLPDADCHVEAGITKMEIMNFIDKQRIDLIVVGRHSRHGLGRLLGSTANAILNSAPCDVFAVREDR